MGGIHQWLRHFPPGVIAHFATNTAPSGWLKANGALVRRHNLRGPIRCYWYNVREQVMAPLNIRIFRTCAVSLLRGLDAWARGGCGPGYRVGAGSQNLSHNHGGSTGGHAMALSGTYHGSLMQQAMKEAVYNAANHTHSISSDGGAGITAAQRCPFGLY